MNWFNQNRWLGIFLIVFGLADLAAICFLLSAKSSSDQAVARFEEAVAEKNRLERLDPFPNEANFRKMKLHLENYAASNDKLKQELKARVPNPPALAPNEFQARLRQAMLSVGERARFNRVKLPDNFALGFEVYTTRLPEKDVAPMLGQQLSQIETLLNFVIDARVDALSKLTRAPLAGERGTASPRPNQSVPGAQELIQRGVVDLTFSSSPSAMRKVLNQVASSPQQFYSVRLLHVRNEKDKGPPKEQPGHAVATAAPPLTPGKTPSAATLNFIVGNEHIETSARIELVRFTF